MASLEGQLTFRRRLLTKKVVLHASHTAPSQSNLEAFLAVKGRTMGLLEVGYHYLILRDGKQIMTRPHSVIGAHAPGYDRESIGVCLAGGIEDCCSVCGGDCASANPPVTYCPMQDGVDNFSPDQWDGLTDLMAYLVDLYGPLRLFGHSELPRHQYRGRKCPPVDMNAIRSYVNG